MVKKTRKSIILTDEELKLSIKTGPSQENIYMIQRLEKEMNGTPQSALANYHNISPYSFSDTTQSALKTPIRIYSEPDVNWWIKEHGEDFSSMNILDCSSMINELDRLGHKDAVLITTHNKGFRKPDHRRHHTLGV